MREETITITNKVGLHARPAALLVKTAAGFTAGLTLVKAGKSYNIKSMLSVMSAAARQGDTVTIRAEGPDEEAALAGVTELIKSGFGEE